MDQGRSRKHVEALHLRIKEYRQELALCKKEAKRAAKALKHAEVRLNLHSHSCESVSRTVTICISLSWHGPGRLTLSQHMSGSCHQSPAPLLSALLQLMIVSTCTLCTH